MADEDVVNANEPTKKRAAAGSRKRVFTKDIKQIMYGYGDTFNPADDTVDVMEDILLMFLEDLCTKALKCSTSNRLKLTDLTFVLRKDPKKLGRVLELITAERELAKARFSASGEGDPLLLGKGRGGGGGGGGGKRVRFGDDDGNSSGGEDNNHYKGGQIMANNSNSNNNSQEQMDDEDDDALD
ncbi:Transcription initiation factor TFIID subunit 13 [Chytriomyces hyalinus]|nr:Transcription initiation factor TFIID subunit 13 [Chytriomyces hyalinus]KAJ3254911.1 Transcription initiation factor TFIID subunit 13 [Chytriomyces hyalinus]